MVFSIIIPTYNRAHLILDTLNSIRNQSFIDYELIIIDDGSTDNTKEVVANYIVECGFKNWYYYYKTNGRQRIQLTMVPDNGADKIFQVEQQIVHRKMQGWRYGL